MDRLIISGSRPRQRSVRIWIFLLTVQLAGAAALGGAAAAEAENGAAATDLISFDIPAQPLASALEAYSTATGVVTVYNGNLAIGQVSAAVRGRFTPQAALRLLLRNTGLVAQYSTRQAFVLVPAPAQTAAMPDPSRIARAALGRQDASERLYSGRMQAGINQSLCATPETRPGAYRLAMRFRIGASGEITQLKLLGSTGDPERDAAIADAVGHTSISEPPPAGMAQPFTILILPQSSGGAVDCPPLAGRRDG